MTLMKCMFIVLLSCLCQATQNSSTQTTNVPVTSDGNNTELQEEVNRDPFIDRLSGKCSWTLRMPGNSSSGKVALLSNKTDLAERVCRGLDCGSVYHVNTTRSPPNTTCFHDCLYQDGRLQNCSQSVGSHCTVITEAVCGHQAVRLAGGRDRCAGRVELWRDGRWGTVCDDQWDLRDADLVCAQLGCGYALNVTGQGGPFPSGRGPIHLDELNCTGKEGNLWACPAAHNDTDCGHKEDAGVVCSEMRAVRLTGGLDRCSGKVEIHRNGSWGTVCDTCWDSDMASMVCSMLQCGMALKSTQFDFPRAHNNGTLWFYQCASKAKNLWQCKEYINAPHLCSTSKSSYLICNGSLGLPTFTTDNVTAIIHGVTVTTTTISPPGKLFIVSPELLTSMSLSVVLFVLLITNTVLCCHYRRRHAFLLQQTRSGQPFSSSSAHRHNDYHDAVNLVKVTANPQQTDDSQRYRTDVNPLMTPSGLNSLREEGPETTNGVMRALTNYNGLQISDPYARVSKITEDSFDSSSTSSGECYENTKPDDITEPGPGQSFVVNGTPDPPRFFFSNDQMYSGQQTNLQNSDDEDDGPIYSPVSPDCDTSSEDEYDDVGS
ncbi:T-cell differentiation antigen CD6-like isoform X2 [Scomber scombrus]|uniref:T-cell differentiation antigen CD6-like isoform X2 n=1 Tax=Scomber scombrus TaxID=13677 RepID=A0AAV1MQP9_SCOSC|nr:T-cell differentiation antigen CD6-like [Scomber scombrus]